MATQAEALHFHLPFNPAPSTILHLDLNSCFATIEQQANPHLRGKPIAVAAYNSPNGCILAPSVEAKTYGVKTGMRVKEGQRLCPNLIVLSSDPWKYRSVHLKLRQLLLNYTDKLTAKSIDEFVLDLNGFPAYKSGIVNSAREIKKRIKSGIGEWLTVSVGIAPNRFLAKLAASLHKPDGLDEINKENSLEVFKQLKLTDLCGIANHNSARLTSSGIYSVLDFYNSDIRTLKSAFNSILGYYWYVRLRGWEIDDVVQARRSYGNSFALPKPFISLEELSPVLSKLVEKMSSRMRKAGYHARGVHTSILYRDGTHWHKGQTINKTIFTAGDIYKIAYIILCNSPRKPVSNLAVSCFNLISSQNLQLDLFGKIERGQKVTKAIDSINERWGSFVLTPARMLGTGDLAKDRISFGGVKELQEFSME